MEEECQRLVTEEEENQIRDVASDINERAFYGKIMRTKKALEQGIKTLHQLSPRSQEIANVMQLVHDSFKSKGIPPVTQITFYRIGKMLGRGAFGKVNLAMHKLVRKLVALKSLNKQILTDETHKAKLMKEVNLLLKLRHNHVVKIYETIETEKHIIIVMELCAGGDLLNYVRKRRRLKEPYA
jgi:serine/threonine protein kinase